MDLCSFALSPELRAKTAALRAIEDEVLARACEIMRDRLPRGDFYREPDVVKQFLIHALAPREQEIFVCMFLSGQNRLIRFEEMFRGTISRTSVHPREVTKRAMTLNAAHVIFAHNHPSGGSEPSNSDIDMTRILASALGLVDVTVLDHLVIGADGSTVSFFERGLMI